MIYARPDEDVTLGINEQLGLEIRISCDGTTCQICENYLALLVRHLAGKQRRGFMSAN